MNKLSFPHHVMVIGSGLAGIMTALELAPHPVILVTQGSLGEKSSSILAQGGIAASNTLSDNPMDHTRDTLKAGVGLCDPKIVEIITTMSGVAIKKLQHYGIQFDQDEYQQPKLSLEAAHSHRRVYHINGDSTGKGIIDGLVQQIRQADHITLYEYSSIERILSHQNQVYGAILCQENEKTIIECGNIVLATGGIGALYKNSTNPDSNYGQGLALAAEIGAIFSDLEFVQFHPTGLNDQRTPKALVSEAVRGEGAILINENNQRFMIDIPGQELAPRDVVTRAITQEYLAGHQVFLDARTSTGNEFPIKFPTIYQLCAEANIDPRTQPIPIKPVEHFHMGGIVTNINGQTSIKGLWAVGECASTGLHGANRLASNSLLETCVMAIRTAFTIKNQSFNPISIDLPTKIQFTESTSNLFLQHKIEACLGIIRCQEKIIDAIRYFLALEPFSKPAKVALMIGVSALLRKESRGSHFREDFPYSLPLALRSFTTYETCLKIAQTYI